MGSDPIRVGGGGGGGGVVGGGGFWGQLLEEINE